MTEVRFIQNIIYKCIVRLIPKAKFVSKVIKPSSACDCVNLNEIPEQWLEELQPTRVKSESVKLSFLCSETTQLGPRPPLFFRLLDTTKLDIHTR
jgi:hypothetical protein